MAERTLCALGVGLFGLCLFGLIEQLLEVVR